MEQKQVNQPLKVFFIFIGSLCVALGVVGMFLPVLPTTPFLLLAAFCYARSSERFYRWLLNNRWFGEYIKNYREGKGIPIQQKIFTLLLLWLTIGSTVLLAISQVWQRLFLFAIALGVTIHLLTIRTDRPGR